MPKKNIRKQKIQTEPDKPSDPSDAAAETEESARPDKSEEKHFPIVGIGASAGGLAAFEAFFSAMPADRDPGMAFVLVQHLAPDHKSILTNLIRQYTRMKVYEVEDGMDVHPNCAYIIPPNRDMAFLNGRLQLLEPSAPRGHRMPIDFFFRSLAHDQRDRSICIVLSGTGSDGTLGLRAVKGEGGMVMAQTPESAEYDGMPRSAIATGLVDYELTPAEMPVRLMAYAAHAFVRLSRPEPKAENALKKIFILMRGQTGHDFSQYKPSTIIRRIERRMAVHQIDTMDEYVRFLQMTPPEVESLFNDFLIGVTGFFRDAKAFRVLEEQIIPKLFAGKSGGTAVRVWCPGCSSGEEAYSIAILLEERMNALKQSFNVQIFATDIDSLAIETGRAGLYPASIAADISRERLEHFFTAAPGGSLYRIRKNIRDMLIFSEQDLIKDPPFSKLDLISCRNVLIYMDGNLQKKIIPLFHYALNPGGFLFLGTSETVGDFSDLFAVQDRKAKLYQRRTDIHSTRTALSHFIPALVAGQQNAGKKIGPAKVPLRELTEQSILRQITAVLVNGHGDILYIHGRTGMYLEPAPGEAGISNLLKMARKGLRRELTTGLHRALKEKQTVHCPSLRVKTNGEYTTVNLSIRPVRQEEQTDPAAAIPEPTLYLITLQEAPETAHQSEEKTGGSDIDDRIPGLLQQLQSKEEYLRAAFEELETSNEELKSSNEEMQSVNEELQSSNEELETSKEELQSVNEELATVNTELQNKVENLSQVNNDMNNLLTGTGISTVLVDHQLRIVRFTAGSSRIINLIQTDVGRPLNHISSNFVGYGTLVEDTQAVLEKLIPKEREVQTTDGMCCTMRIQPYRTIDNVIEGAVFTFVDITAMKNAQEELRLNEERMRIALRAASVTVFNQDRKLRYTWIFNPHSVFFPEPVLGKTDADLFSAGDANRLREIKQQVMESGKGARQEVRTVINGKAHFCDLTVEPLYDPGGEIIGITCALMDISDRKQQDRESEEQPKEGQ